jgi:hypothetical protein
VTKKYCSCKELKGDRVEDPCLYCGLPKRRTNEVTSRDVRRKVELQKREHKEMQSHSEERE